MGQTSSYDIDLYIKPLAPTVTGLIGFRFWVAHQEDPKKDAHNGINLLPGHWCLLIRVSTRMLFAELHADQLSGEVKRYGFASFLTNSRALAYMAGFVKDGHMTVGVHISVPVTDAVRSRKMISSNLQAACPLGISPLHFMGTCYKYRPMSFQHKFVIP